MARGEDHAHRALQPDLARQPVHAAGERGEADARLRKREGGVLRGNDEVAGQRNFKTAAHRDAVDGGDDRLLGGGEAGGARATPRVPQPRVPPAPCHFRSLPAQNALSPAPVTIATHCSGSAEKSSNTLLSSKCASICSALYTSGRNSVTIVTGPLRVTLENFKSMFAPVDFFLWCGMWLRY